MRTEGETQLLKHEAQLRARAGWSRPDISRALGVPMVTLARWAFEGGWRDKDIAAENEAARLALLRERLEAQRQRAPHPLRAPAGAWNTPARAWNAPGRNGAAADHAVMEYKSLPGPEGVEAFGDAFGPPPPDPAPDLRYPSGDPDYSPWERDEKRPKFLTRGGDPNEQVCWAAPQLWARTPPWAPGNEIEETELASLWLAEDLMRQGLLNEAEKALRFTKNWLTISRQVFDKQDEEDARRREHHERQEQERAREKARCKALGLPDPDEVWEARCKAMMASIDRHMARAAAHDSGDNTDSGDSDDSGASAANRSSSGPESLPNSLVTAPG